MEDNPDFIHFIQTMWVEDQTGTLRENEGFSGFRVVYGPKP